MEKRIYYLQLNQLLIDFFNQKHLDSSFKKTSTDISEQWLKAIWTQPFFVLVSVKSYSRS